MKILLITDKPAGAEHSAIDGIFKSAMPQLANIRLVYFTRGENAPAAGGNILHLSYRHRRSGLPKALGNALDLSALDLVIVRNTFPVLKQVLGARSKFKFRVAFWESFAHTFREFFQARELGRAVMRKRLEYGFKRRLQQRLIAGCDLYLPITAAFKAQFHPRLDLPWHPLPMGIDVAKLPPASPHEPVARSFKTFVYTGAVDPLRRLDVIVQGFRQTKADVRLDIFTPSQNKARHELAALADPRIRVLAPLPRAELMARFPQYDAGIGLIPDNELFRASSPTKTLEYYAMGLPALIDRLPEYMGLFDDQSAFFCDFQSQAITRTLEVLHATPASDLAAKGAAGKRLVCQKRDYQKLAAGLLSFITQSSGV